MFWSFQPAYTKRTKLGGGTFRREAPRGVQALDSEVGPSSVRPPPRAQNSNVLPVRALSREITATASYRPQDVQGTKERVGARTPSPGPHDWLRGDGGRVPPVHLSASDRLLLEVLGGKTWHAACRVSQLLKDVPTSFTSHEHYVRIFEPILHEEAREELKQGWEEACTNNKRYQVTISRVVAHPRGWFDLRVDLKSDRGWNRQEFWEDSLMVLQPHSAGQKQGSNPPKKKRRLDKEYGREGTPEPPGDLIMAAVVSRVPNSDYDGLSLRAHPCCACHSEQDPDAPCSRIVQELYQPGTTWSLVPAGRITTNTRECEALHEVSRMPLLHEILHPDQRLAVPLEQLKPQWPAEVSVKAFVEWLVGKYDFAQRQAIELAAAQVAPIKGPHTSDASPSSRPGGTLPFVLIQGPPGTGKTHTVLGILNTWHLTQFTRYFHSWASIVRSRFSRMVDLELDNMSTASIVEEKRREISSSTRDLAYAPKPRILVCAPSNAAIDELLERILRSGFKDTNARTYYPNVVRVGPEEALSEDVKQVRVETLAKRFLDMDEDLWHREMDRVMGIVSDCAKEVLHLRLKMRGSVGTPEEDDTIRQLSRAEEDLLWVVLEQERLLTVENKVFNQRYNFRSMRDSLEVSFMDNAQMVFTTLSSSGRAVFSKVRKKFELVLIDEAAQAQEVATLQPLIHGATRCVLVGDPQQLPATVFSKAAKSVLLERSLFERLQLAGCPVKMLSVQYRMRPEIRQFPSHYFYQDALKDAECIVQAPPPPFYRAPLLKPYVVFDVNRGQMTTVSRSLQNVAEAEMAAALFWELWTYMEGQGERWGHADEEGPPPTQAEDVTVGVLTPYRSQRDLIKRTFSRYFLPEHLKNVKIETIDSFQGKQVDVVILSCVRGRSHHTGVGFLSDVRRMNVAITRAKKALWVLGNLSVLEADDTWSALIGNARDRQCIISKASASGLFPRHRYPGMKDQDAQGDPGGSGLPPAAQGGKPGGLGGEGGHSRAPGPSYAAWLPSGTRYTKRHSDGDESPEEGQVDEQTPPERQMTPGPVDALEALPGSILPYVPPPPPPRVVVPSEVQLVHPLAAMAGPSSSAGQVPPLQAAHNLHPTAEVTTLGIASNTPAVNHHLHPIMQYPGQLPPGQGSVVPPLPQQQGGNGMKIQSPPPNHGGQLPSGQVLSSFPLPGQPVGHGLAGQHLQSPAPMTLPLPLQQLGHIALEQRVHLPIPVGQHPGQMGPGQGSQSLPFIPQMAPAPLINPCSFAPPPPPPAVLHVQLPVECRLPGMQPPQATSLSGSAGGPLHSQALGQVLPGGPAPSVGSCVLPGSVPASTVAHGGLLWSATTTSDGVSHPHLGAVGNAPGVLPQLALQPVNGIGQWAPAPGYSPVHMGRGDGSALTPGGRALLEKLLVPSHGLRPQQHNATPHTFLGSALHPHVPHPHVTHIPDHTMHVAPASSVAPFGALPGAAAPPVTAGLTLQGPYHNVSLLVPPLPVSHH